MCLSGVYTQTIQDLESISNSRWSLLQLKPFCINAALSCCDDTGVTGVCTSRIWMQLRHSGFFFFPTSINNLFYNSAFITFNTCEIRPMNMNILKRMHFMFQTLTFPHFQTFPLPRSAPKRSKVSAISKAKCRPFTGAHASCTPSHWMTSNAGIRFKVMTE